MEEERDEIRSPEGERVDVDSRDDRAAAGREVAERNHRPDRDPHHRLNNPAEDPDPSEHPDPYEERPDPRGPDAEREEQTAPSTSEPAPPRNREAVKREGYER